MRKRFTLVIVPHCRGQAVEIGGPAVLSGGLIGLFLFLLILWHLGSTYAAAWFDAGLLARLEQDNTRLLAQLDALERYVASSRQAMSRLVQRDREARVVAGLPDIPPEIRQLGVGGPLDPSFVGDPTNLGQDLRHLLREIQLEMASFKTIEWKAVQDRRSWRRIPTVRPVKGWLTSVFGMREDPLTGRHRMHRGVDIGARRGEPVRATADGVVRTTGWDAKYGRYMDIDHHNGYLTRYGHLDEITAKRGDRVRRGQAIGMVGKTGRATGYHLHYEVRRYGRALDPRSYFYPEIHVVD